MNNKRNLFKTSLSVPIFESYNKAIFNLLKTPEYRNYTDVVLSTFGQELEKYLDPQNFRLKYRYKSEKSFNKNISKDTKINENNFSSDFNKYITYDIIGMRLVIENVPENFKINDNFILKCKSMKKLLTKQLYSLITDENLQNNQSNTNLAEHLGAQIKYLDSCINFSQLLSRRNELNKKVEKMQENGSIDNCSDEDLKSAKTILNNLNNSLGMIVGDFCISEIFANSDNIKKLGLYLDSNREKYFNDSSGYNSKHFCIKSTLYPNWISELQDRSSFVEFSSKYGPNTHDKIPGKKRRLLPLPKFSNKNDINRYISRIEYVLPLYTKYVSNGQVKKYTKKEDVKHYYKKLFLENPDYAKQVNKVLYDRPTIIYTPMLSDKESNLEK